MFNSLLTLLKLFLDFFLDKRNLKVTANIDRSSFNKPVLVLIMRNTGRRPIILIQIVIAKKKTRDLRNTKHFSIFNSPAWPKKLLEAEKELYFLEDLNIFSSILRDEYSYIFALDSLDKRYVVNKKNIKALHSNAAFVNYYFHQERGMNLYLKRNNKEALEEYFKALKYEPQNANTHFYLGEAFARDQNYTNAIIFFKKAIELGFFDTSKALYSIALVYSLLCYEKETFDYLNKAVLLNHDLKRISQSEEALAKYRDNPDFLRIVENANNSSLPR